MAEQLALEQARRDGGAVDLDERPPSAPTQVVNGTGDQLLAGARLAADEHGRVRRRDRLHLVQHAFQRRGLTDDVLEVVLGADLVLEVDLLRGELVLELGDLLERERVLDREGDLARSGDQELRVAIGERLGAEPADAECPQPAVVHRERHAAHRLDAFGEQHAADVGLERREIRTLEPRGLTRRERFARGRALHRDEHVLLDQPLAGELERPHVERVSLAVVDREARVVVRHDAPQARRDGAEQRARLEVRDERVVHLEQQPEPIPFARQLPLRPLSGLVMERVVDGQRHLARELLQDLDVGVGEGIFVLAREAEPAETAERRREGEHAARSHAFGAQDPSDLGEARLTVDARHDKGPLRLPHEARRGLGHGQLEVGREGWLE